MHPIFEGYIHYIMNLVFNLKDTNTFASSSLDGHRNASLPKSTLEAHEKGIINYVEFYAGADKPYLLTYGDDRTVKVWDYHGKSSKQTLERHTDNVSFAIFHPNLPRERRQHHQNLEKRDVSTGYESAW